MVVETVEVNERRDCEQHSSDQRERLVPHVVPSLERQSPYSSSTGTGNQARKSRSDKRSVSSTHSMPNAQPPITSLGQWTPSITRLMPISSDRKIAPAAAGRCQRVRAVSTTASVR